MSEHVSLQVFLDVFCLTQGILSCSLPFGQRLISPVVQSMIHGHTGTNAAEQQRDADVGTYWNLARVCVITVFICPQEWLSLKNKTI